MHGVLKIEEAIVYAITKSGSGLTTDQIAAVINRQHLYLRADGQPVTSKQVYAVIMRYPMLFCKEEGRIRVMM